MLTLKMDKYPLNNKLGTFGFLLSDLLGFNSGSIITTKSKVSLSSKLFVSKDHSK